MSQTRDSAERPELASVDGLPPPDGLPRGECIVRALEDGRLHIERADPRILISAEIVDKAAFGVLHRDVAFDLSHYADGHVGALLKIRGANRQVVYRLTEWIPRIRAYVGEWPD